jgi:hypothetical protein
VHVKIHNAGHPDDEFREGKPGERVQDSEHALGRAQ